MEWEKIDEEGKEKGKKQMVGVTTWLSTASRCNWKQTV